MFVTFTSCAKSIGMVGAGFALAGIAAWPLQAAAQNPAAEAGRPTASPEAVVSTAHQVAVIDAATGQLRAATAEEARALHARSGVSHGSPRTTLSKVHPSGARGVRLTDEFMSYSMAVQRADGSLVTQCVHSQAEVEAVLKTPVAARFNNAPTE